ncbi:MAG: tryptophan synthase subunit alpha, partial [Actinobacteria bacterium]|nr:tryptophan synthase subunit alpha [Actinomycetota bacterium]
MSGRLTEMFNRLKGDRAALIAYATGFYPDGKESAEVIKAMLSSGADAVEIGLPFSDPVIDGPVIQESSRLALENGATPGAVLELVSEIRADTGKPIMIMS